MDQAITHQEFTLFQRLIYRIAGINLADSKQTLLVGRLQRRLRQYNLNTFSEYYRMLASGDNPAEVQTMVDLLTTNETYFFREPTHFEFLSPRRPAQLPPGRQFPRLERRQFHRGRTLHPGHATCRQTGQHAMGNRRFGYQAPRSWAKARQGHYPMDRNEGIPQEYLRKYCLKGVRAQAGTFLIAPQLRERVTFRQINLTQPIPSDMGSFQIIFLRNVMIYFDPETKRKVVANLLPRLLPGGYLIIGHSESLNGITDQLTTIKPTIYRKP